MGEWRLIEVGRSEVLGEEKLRVKRIEILGFGRQRRNLKRGAFMNIEQPPLPQPGPRPEKHLEEKPIEPHSADDLVFYCLDRGGRGFDLVCVFGFAHCGHAVRVDDGFSATGS